MCVGNLTVLVITFCHRLDDACLLNAVLCVQTCCAVLKPFLGAKGTTAARSLPSQTVQCMSLPAQQHKVSQKHQQVTQNPAKAVQYVCRLLRSYGVDQLSPELVRQAKFDAQMVRSGWDNRPVVTAACASCITLQRGSRRFLCTLQLGVLCVVRLWCGGAHSPARPCCWHAMTWHCWSCQGSRQNVLRRSQSLSSSCSRRRCKRQMQPCHSQVSCCSSSASATVFAVLLSQSQQLRNGWLMRTLADTITLLIVLMAL